MFFDILKHSFWVTVINPIKIHKAAALTTLSYIFIIYRHVQNIGMRTVHPIWYRWLKSRVWLTATEKISVILALSLGNGRELPTTVSESSEHLLSPLFNDCLKIQYTRMRTVYHHDTSYNQLYGYDSKRNITHINLLWKTYTFACVNIAKRRCGWFNKIPKYNKVRQKHSTNFKFKNTQNNHLKLLSFLNIQRAI